MFNPLKAFGDLHKMQSQAHHMRDMLKKEEVVVEKDGVKVTVRGDQEVREVMIDGVVENRVTHAINEAVKKTQELAARKLMEISQS
ncbi:MAG TPA: YbaB/EbfC family nucleoid-associated protein [Patescibacteria group bacterium]|nr:YbaB/EbfC family nucleoid-associated protein [Patescibacteria group bacterium]